MRKNRIFVSLFASFVVCSCSTLKEPVVYENPDYSIEDVRRDEIRKTEELLEKNNVQALWRASIIGDGPTIERCFESVVASFNSALEDKSYFAARNLYKSLKAMDYPKLSSLGKSESELEKLCMESVPGLSSASAPRSASKKVSSYISGTVTIWVDKGIAVHNGYGYADRVIGSGFFISDDGYIITNNHVIADVVDPKNEKYTRLFIKLAADDDTRIPAKVVGWDPVLDLALLKTEVEVPFVFNLGSSEDLDVGDKIYAIGSPIGLERTLTSGIVSAVDRKMFSLGSVMQIDAAVNSGNSGGPCVDSDGNVQAVVFAGMLQYTGLNFAIPVEYLKIELPALYAGGKLVHSWIGAFGKTKKSMGKDSGVEVQYVLPGGSAFRSGVKVGDVITEVDGVKVATVDELQNALMKTPAKSIVKVKFSSGGASEGNAERTVPVYLASRPDNPGLAVYEGDIIKNAFTPIYGLRLEGTAQGKRHYVISEVLKGSIGDESGFSENDYLEIKNIKFNDEKTAIIAEVYSKNRKKGYLDINMALPATLDSPYYF